MAHFSVNYDSTVAEVVLNNPKKFNMLSLAWAAELDEILVSLENNDAVRVVLFWAEGKMFTAGLDLAEFARISSQACILRLSYFALVHEIAPKSSQAVKSLKFHTTLRNFQKPLTRLEKFKKPVVVAVHGKCIGGGIDFISACDIRLATKDAEFSVKETQIAMVADLGTIPRLTRIVGKGIYNEMVFTGEAIDSAKALRTGLVNEVYEDKEQLLAGARALCKKIAANSPLAVQGAKHILRWAEEHTFDDTLAYVGLWNSAFLESEDLLEAATAFFQKRNPVFINKL